MPMNPLFPVGTYLPDGEHSVEDCIRIMGTFDTIEQRKSVQNAINLINYFKATHIIVQRGTAHGVKTKELPKSEPIVDPFELPELSDDDAGDEPKRRGAPKGGWPRKGK